MHVKSLLFVLFWVFGFQPGLSAQHFLEEMPDLKTFQEFSGKPLSDKYGNALALKVIYVVAEQKVYFLDARHYQLHYEFCVPYIEDFDLKQFNILNYSDRSDRAFLLGDVNYFSALDQYVLSIAPSDKMPVALIHQLHQAVEANSFCEPLYLFLNSNRLRNEAKAFENLKCFYPSDIYAQSDFQAISSSTGEGSLKFIDDLSEQADEIDARDIIVLNETPIHLPEVAGIIVTEFQTPLSHISLLGRNRKIPICAWQYAFESEELKKLEGTKVSFTVAQDTFAFRSIDKFSPVVRSDENFRMEYDLSVTTLMEIDSVDFQANKYVGNKAACFGELHKLSKTRGFKVPELAFAIPFHFYADVLRRSGARDIIDELLADAEGDIDESALVEKLSTIRQMIAATPVDQGLLSALEKHLSNKPYERFRFRSSTNAEDCVGFSGAGLYASKTGIINHSDKTFERAILKVYASLWSYEAFAERRLFNIDHREVFMGVLVHRAFPNESVNGVAVTKNIYQTKADGFVINAQKGNENVVAPSKGVTCDQFIAYPDDVNTMYSNTGLIDIIALSTLGDGTLLMSEAEINTLANELAFIRSYFYQLFKRGPYDTFALDLEFKLDGANRDLYLKQVRPFN